MMLKLLPLALSGAEAGAWVAALAGVLALGKQVWDVIRKHRTENQEIEEALNHAPEVRRQLELGNIGAAVEHLNAIIKSQNDHILSQDNRLREADVENARLREQKEAAEAEADGWERKHNELEAHREMDQMRHDRQVSDLNEQMDAQKRSFARTLAQLRSGGEVEGEQE